MTKVFNKDFQKEIRRKLRRNMPKAEVLLWQRLRGRKLGGVKFRRQFSVGKYILDFYSPKYKLGIEVDGDTHFESGETETKDLNRQKYVESFGIKVIRFTNHEIYKDLARVLEDIKKLTSPSPSL